MLEAGGGKVAVYPGRIMLLRFMVDFLLLMGSNRLCGKPIRIGRTALAAFLGAAYTVACIRPDFYFLGGAFWRLCVLVGMTVLSFGWNWSALQRGAIYLFLSLAWGGLAMHLGMDSPLSVLLCALVLTLLCLLGFRGKAGQARHVPVTITHGDTSVQLTALVDTGNMLQDPVSGKSVLVADGGAGAALLGLSVHQLEDPVQTLCDCAIPGLLLIPYCTVGKPRGLLLGLKVDKLMLDGKESDSIVAFAPQQLGSGKDFQALAGGML